MATRKEEPTYMSVARFNAAKGFDSSPLVVRELLARIDRLEAERNGNRNV